MTLTPTLSTGSPGPDDWPSRPKQVQEHKMPSVRVETIRGHAYSIADLQRAVAREDAGR